MLLAQQLVRTRLHQHRLQQQLAHRAFDQTLPVLREYGRVPHRIVHLQTHEPAEKQVVVHLLHQLPLRTNRVENHQQRGPQKPLGSNRRTACRRVQLLQLAIQTRQGPVHQNANLPHRVIGGNPLRQG